jgi:Tfp pilus assembly protein PilF
MRAAPFSRARVEIWCMKVPVLLWMAAACAACLLAPTTAPAQGASPAHAVLTSPADVQLRSYLEQAAEAMHNGDLASAAEKLRRALGIDPHSLAALNNLGTGFPGRDQDHWSAR